MTENPDPFVATPAVPLNSPYERLQEVLRRLNNPRPSGGAYSARCPAHNDHKPSLRLGLGRDGGVWMAALLDSLTAWGASIDDLEAVADLIELDGIARALCVLDAATRAALYRLELVCDLPCSQYAGTENPAQFVNTSMRSGPHKLHGTGEPPASHG